LLAVFVARPEMHFDLCSCDHMHAPRGAPRHLALQALARG
jgi:hypothetical protein